MNFGEFKDGKAQQLIPPALAPHEAEISNFATLCNKTCERILKLLALGLEVCRFSPKRIQSLLGNKCMQGVDNKGIKIETDFFTSCHDPIKGPTGSILRFLYYPSIFSEATASYKHDVDVRAGAHSDYGSITLLFQRPGQPGLEILTTEGTWAPVPVQPNNNTEEFPFPPILVNIGDLLSYWTDGLLKSTIHRVVFPLDEQRSPNPRDRYSIAYFCHPVDTTELVPVPSKIVIAYREQSEASGVRNETIGFGGGAGSLEPGKRALTAKEHLESRLDATYGFKKEEASS